MGSLELSVVRHFLHYELSRTSTSQDDTYPIDVACSKRKLMTSGGDEATSPDDDLDSNSESTGKRKSELAPA